MTEPRIDLLEVDDVRYARGGRTILDGVSFQARRGEAVAVVGPSGSGKSSLLALVAGIEAPDSGQVRVDGSVLDARRGASFGMVLQSYGLVNLLTAAENVEIALQARRVDAEQVRARAAHQLSQVGLAGVADHLIDELSGGEQQRTAIARALAVDPPVLIADEITAELDPRSKERVLELVFGPARRNRIVVIATHDPNVAALCDRSLMITDGRLA